MLIDFWQPNLGGGAPVRSVLSSRLNRRNLVTFPIVSNSVASRAARVFGWTTAALVIAMLWSFFLIPDASNPDDRDAENWLLLPLLLGAAALSMSAVAVVAWLVSLGRRERIGVATAVPLAAGVTLAIVPGLWLLSLLR